MAEEPGKYWVAMAVDNSIPRPEPDEESGFLPRYFNASPLLLPTDEGEDAICVFSTEGKFWVYITAAGREQEASMVPATPVPLRGREDFRQFFVHYPVSNIVVDPEYGTSRDESIGIQEFMSSLEP